MTEHFRTSFAAQLAELRSEIALSWTPMAPDAGFVLWADRLGSAGLAGPDLPLPDLTLVSDLRWNEAPVLAAAGYYLDLGIGEWEQALEPWIRGAARLILREPFPADRTTFVFRPVELLGVALGARAAADRAPEVRKWLTGVVNDARFRPSRNHWAGVLGALTFSVLDETPPPLPLPEATDLADTALSLWAHIAHTDLAPKVDIDALRRGLLTRAGVKIVTAADNARRGTLWIALDNAVRTLLGSALAPGSGEFPADQVAGLCRRFPSFVRELQHRQRGGHPFAVKNEYDVQDLMRALLRLHFTDVRLEETTPSRAGMRPRMDFLLKVEKVVLETKMTRERLGQRGLAEEISVDKESYRAHPDCRTVVFFVYDPDHRVNNPAALESEMSGDDGRLRTIVVVSPT